MDDMTSEYRLLVRKQEERDHLQYLGTDWRIKLKWILQKQDMRL